MTATMSRMEEEANDAGFFKQRVAGSDQRKMEWIVRCTTCPAFESHMYGPTTPAHLMVKNARNKGWAVGHKVKPRCPECKHKRPDQLGAVAHALFNGSVRMKSDRPLRTAALAQAGDAALWDPADRAIEGGKQMDRLKETVQMVQQVAETINESMIKRMVRVQKRLEQVFDATARMYKDGLTEEKLAKELKISVDALAELRHELYGPLAEVEDPRFTAFRQEASQLRVDISAAVDRLGELDSKTANLLTRFEHWLVTRKISGKP